MVVDLDVDKDLVVLVAIWTTIVTNSPGTLKTFLFHS